MAAELPKNMIYDPDFSERVLSIHRHVQWNFFGSEMTHNAAVPFLSRDGSELQTTADQVTYNDGCDIPATACNTYAVVLMMHDLPDPKISSTGANPPSSVLS